MKKVKFTRNWTICGVTVECPHCGDEIHYNKTEATELLGHLWYPVREPEVKCPECQKVFEIDPSGSEDDV